jgi:beta-1,4-mannosyltransferase
MKNQNINIKLKVLVYPKASNPYQDLLYKHFPTNENISIKYINGPESVIASIMHIFTITWQLIVDRISGYELLHLHWLYPFEFPGYRVVPIISNAIYTAETIVFLTVVKLLQFKLVWTVHDLVPLDRHMFNELKIIQKLVNQTKRLILLSSTTMEDMKRLNLTFDTSKISIIPLGNYIGFYPNVINKYSARKMLGIPQEAFIFLFFGRIEPYKNIPGLLETFKLISKTYPNAYLIIAGKIDNTKIINALNEAKDTLGKKLVLHLNHIPDDEVQIYFNAANTTVNPFFKITNSSSTMLSASFGKSIIVPRLGALKDISDDVGFFYNSNDSNGLFDCMQKALSLSDIEYKKKEESSINYARSLSWNRIAKQTYEVYKKVLTI